MHSPLRVIHGLILGTVPYQKILIAIPAWNEAGSIDTVVASVREHRPDADILVVNDGSTDASQEILDSITDPRVTVMRHEVNQGKGAAIRTGIQAATAPYVGIQDADLEYDPADLQRLLTPLQAGLADAVYGSRFLTSDYHRVLYYWHSVGNRALTLASNMLTNINLTDMETCYKVFRRELIQSIPIEENRFGFEPEITVKLAKRKVRIYEVGISYSGRTYEEGKKINWKDGVSAMRCLIKYSFQKNRDSY